MSLLLPLNQGHHSEIKFTFGHEKFCNQEIKEYEKNDDKVKIKNIEVQIPEDPLKIVSTLDMVRTLVKHKKNRVLIVDAEEFCISAMKAIFNFLKVDYEHNIDFCINGQEAIDLIVNGYELGLTYCLIMTDFSMPVMDGIESVRKIR